MAAVGDTRTHYIDKDPEGLICTPMPVPTHAFHSSRDSPCQRISSAQCGAGDGAVEVNQESHLWHRLFPGR